MNEEDIVQSTEVRYGADISIIKSDNSILENTTVFTMKSVDKVYSEVYIGFNTASQESDISNISITFESMIVSTLNKPGMLYKLDESNPNGIIIRLVNMAPEYFNNLRGHQDVYIFTSRKVIGTYDRAEISIELIVQLVKDTDNTLVITFNLYSKNTL